MKFLGVEGFPGDTGKSCLDIERNLLRHGVGRAGKSGRFGVRRTVRRLPDPAQEFNAAHFRHVDVENHQVEPVSGGQAQRLATVLKGAGVSVKVLGDREANHNSLNNRLGEPGDANTREVLAFVAAQLK